MPTVFTLEGCFPGLGDATAQAQAYYEQGQNYFNAGNYDDAAAAFQQSYTLSPQADTLYDLGQAYWNAGEWSNAKDAYQRYLAASPNADDAATVQGYINQIDAKLAATRQTLTLVIGGIAVVALGIVGTVAIVHSKRDKDPHRKITRRYSYAY